MPQIRKKIALIILGGTVLSEEEPAKNAVIDNKDVIPWLKKIPEVNIIADIEPFFVLGEKNTEVNIDHWIKAGKIIADKIKEFDGFVITHHVTSLLHGACALSFMLQNLPKPVIFTGSQIPLYLSQKAINKKILKKYRGLGIKANLINAVQVAIQGPSEVTIIFGNKLVRANQAIKEKGLSLNLFDAPASGILGTIDFGIKIEEQSHLKIKSSFKFQSKFEKKVSVVSMYPEENYDILDWILAKKPKGIVIYCHNANISQKQINKIAELQKNIPIVLHTVSPLVQKEAASLMMVDNIIPEATLLKFMWILGQTKTQNKILKLLKENIANEIMDEEE